LDPEASVFDVDVNARRELNVVGDQMKKCGFFHSDVRNVSCSGSLGMSFKNLVSVREGLSGMTRMVRGQYMKV